MKYVSDLVTTKSQTCFKTISSGGTVPSLPLQENAFSHGNSGEGCKRQHFLASWVSWKALMPVFSQTSPCPARVPAPWQRVGELEVPQPHSLGNCCISDGAPQIWVLWFSTSQHPCLAPALHTEMLYKLNISSTAWPVPVVVISNGCTAFKSTDCFASAQHNQLSYKLPS